MYRNFEKSQLIVISCQDGGTDPSENEVQCWSTDGMSFSVCSSGYISSLTVVSASGEVHVP